MEKNERNCNNEVKENNKENEVDKTSSEVIFTYTPVTSQVASFLLSDMKELPSVQIGEYRFHLELQDPSPSIKEVARTELRETPDVAATAIKELRELLAGEKNLKVPLDRDSWLIRFLRPCKFYPDSALKLVKRYYSFKQKHAAVYDGLKPSQVQNVFEQNILIFQQERDQFGRRIVIVEFGKRWDPDKVSLDDFFKGLVLLIELGMLEPQTQICGVVVIFDMQGLTFRQASKFTPSNAKRLIDWIQDSVPLRIKNLHFVNQSYIFKIIFQLFKPVLGEKLRKRLILHGYNYENLHKYIDKDRLTRNYGGTLELPEIDLSVWLKILLHCDKEYEAINQYGYNNTK